MIDLEESITALEVKRAQLLAQIEAVNRAISILRLPLDSPPAAGTTQDAASTPTPDPTPIETVQIAAPEARKRGRRPGFTLSDAHKRALLEGRRRKQQAATTAAASPAEEPAALPAIMTWNAAQQPPRLRRAEPAPQERRDLVVEPEAANPFAELLDEAAALY